MHTGPLLALVNDDSRLLELASDILDRRGFRTALYALDEDAYVGLRLSRPDAIIMSLSSEHPTSGWQLLTLLRLDHDLATTPVILCSPDLRMLSDKVARLRALDCELLEEPFTEHALLAKVQAIFTRLVGRDSV